ncbi:MAG: hypothetical protein WAL87_03190 [Chthoniobacterales bacterium]
MTTTLTAPLHEALSAGNMAETEEDFSELETMLTTVKKTPQLDPTALHGIAGEVVKKILPHTESSEPALLVQFLACMGNILGMAPHTLADGSQHRGNLFLVLVGGTSAGRKGTSWSNIDFVLKDVDVAWKSGCVDGGLSSGEGLIMRLSPSQEPDAPPHDPRLLVKADEFASVMKVAARPENILSGTLRDAWDGRPLAVMTRKDPLKAPASLVSIIGHITKTELLSVMNKVEATNGYANRFLWIHTERSKELPHGGRLHEVDFTGEVSKLREIVRAGRKRARVTRDKGADEYWESIYPELNNPPGDIVGSITARGPAQVLRLSFLYALLDSAPHIQRQHIKAAYALWQYSVDTVAFVFGDTYSNPDSQRIWERLACGPATLGEIHNLFNRNRTDVQIRNAIEELGARVAIEKNNHTGGRPSTILRRAK